MLNYIWFGLIVVAVVVAGARDANTGGHATIEAVTKAAVESAQTGVTLAIGLVGVMSMWLGLMRLAEKGGLITVLARVMKPVMRRLFPDVPPEHPAMGAMLMNMAANVLGVSNAATPLGLKAMEELEKLNPHKGTATNAMCTFLAINTSSIQLVPASAVAIMVASQAREPQAIVGTALMATTISTLVGVTSVKLLEKLPMFRVPDAAPNEEAAS